MSKITIDTADMVAIGDAIRTKLDVETAYKASEMPAAILSIPGGGITPTGTISIDSNGIYDVTQYASAAVNVSGGGSGDDPFGLTDFIESSGTQYIDTGYIIQSNSRLEIVCNIANANSYPNPFGTRAGAYNNSCCLWFRSNNTNLTTYIWSNENGRPAENNIYWGGNTNHKIVLTADQSGIKIDVDTFYNTGGLANAYAATPVNPYPLFLFAMNSGGTVDSATLATMKLYRFRIYEGNAIAHEFIPWQDNGVACLKDTVTGNLKYNAGTGVFTYGSDNA